MYSIKTLCQTSYRTINHLSIILIIWVLTPWYTLVINLTEFITKRQITFQFLHRKCPYPHTHHVKNITINNSSLYITSPINVLANSASEFDVKTHAHHLYEDHYVIFQQNHRIIRIVISLPNNQYVSDIFIFL
jgi:hypothetical protein